MSTTPNADLIARFVLDHPNREYPAEVLDAAKQCLVDWIGVSLGALGDPAAARVHRTVSAWRTQGRAPMFLGGRAAPMAAALANGTLAHCLDYDDTHIESILHGSGPTWAATLAMGCERGASERNILSAFITGFEVGTRIGNGGIGIKLNHVGWHTTCTLGRFSCAMSAGALLGLDMRQLKHALGIAATQVGGLTISIGSQSKPFHSGKTAADGVLAAELAAQGLESAPDTLDSDKGLIPTLFQDSSARVRIEPFGERWEVMRNSFKPYAACQLTHASIDSARRLAGAIEGAQVTRVRALVNPLAIKLAGQSRHSTPTEGKFSLAYTIALGLKGHRVTARDFSPERLNDPAISALAAKVETAERDDVDRTQARLEIMLADGRTLTDETSAAYGSVGNPMQWPDLEAKFLAMAEPVLGTRARELLTTLRHFETPRSLERVIEIIDARSKETAPA